MHKSISSKTNNGTTHRMCVIGGSREVDHTSRGRSDRDTLGGQFEVVQAQGMGVSILNISVQSDMFIHLQENGPLSWMARCSVL